MFRRAIRRIVGPYSAMKDQMASSEPLRRFSKASRNSSSSLPKCSPSIHLSQSMQSELLVVESACPLNGCPKRGQMPRVITNGRVVMNSPAMNTDAGSQLPTASKIANLVGGMPHSFAKKHWYRRPVSGWACGRRHVPCRRSRPLVNTPPRLDNMGTEFQLLERTG